MLLLCESLVQPLVACWVDEGLWLSSRPPSMGGGPHVQQSSYMSLAILPDWLLHVPFNNPCSERPLLDAPQQPRWTTAVADAARPARPAAVFAAAPAAALGAAPLLDCCTARL